MKTAAFRTVVLQAIATARRFPATLAAALLAAGIAITLVDHRGDDQSLVAALQATVLGFPLLTVVALAGERFDLRRPVRIASAAIGFAILLLFFSLARSEPAILAWTRWWHWALAFHLLMAIVPFAHGPTGTGFWQYNRILFQRFLLAGLYSAVLFVGLAVALAALDRLLGVSIDRDLYPRLFAVTALLFNTWFFLGGIPTDFGELERTGEYPRGLKVFAQYLLIPLVSVYLVILTSYLARIVLTRTWPSGWVGYLVSSVAAVGTLALLLVHPVRSRPEERWVDGYGRWFFVAMLPALAMLLLAIGKRIGQYGVTEPRFALLLLALWFTAVSAYYAVTGSRSIRLIPGSLCLVALVTTFGPWSMVSVSRRSQTGRFHAILTRHGLRPGGPGPAGPAIPLDDRRELLATARYLYRTHGPAALAEAAGVPPSTLAGAGQTSDPPERLLFSFGIDPTTAETHGYAVLNAAWGAEGLDPGLDLGDGHRLYPGRSLLSPFSVRWGADTVAFIPHRAAGQLDVQFRGTTVATFDLARSLAPRLADPGAPRAKVPPEPVTIRQSAAGITIRLVIESATWYFAAADSLNRYAAGAIVLSK